MRCLHFLAPLLLTAVHAFVAPAPHRMSATRSPASVARSPRAAAGPSMIFDEIGKKFQEAVAAVTESPDAARRPSPAVAVLLELCRDGAPREVIEAVIDKLPPSPAGADITGRWELAYTSEKEVLFLRENGLLGLPCTGIFQDISTEQGRLEQLVLFDGGFLRVGSTCTTSASSPRVDFKFDSCAARWKGLELPLPPYGQGWFDTVYVDGSVRISRDVRGDTQVVTRVGPSELYASPESPASLEQAVSTLQRAAATKAVGPDAVINALLFVERRMRENCKANSAKGSEQLEKLNGAWRLVFTTGTLDTQAKLSGNSSTHRRS